MAEIWQNIAIILLLIIAVVYLVFYYLKSRKNKNECKDCPLFTRIEKINKEKNNNSSSSNKKQL